MTVARGTLIQIVNLSPRTLAFDQGTPGVVGIVGNRGILGDRGSKGLDGLPGRIGLDGRKGSFTCNVHRIG